jgi:transposase
MMRGERRPPVVVTAEERAVVEARLARRDLPRRVRERLEMVKARAVGQGIPAISDWSGRSPRTVRYWLDRYRAEGIEGLADQPRAGRPPRADAAYRHALEEAVMRFPPELGLGFDVWTSARLSAYLAETTGVEIAPSWLRTLLAQQDFVCGRPKHTLRHLRDAEEVAVCEKELQAAGENRGPGPAAL